MIPNVGLDRGKYSNRKRPLIDYEPSFLRSLSPEDLDYLSRYHEEATNARFNHSGKKIIKSVKKKREIYGENNRRNRDLYSLAAATGGLVDISTHDTHIDSVLIQSPQSASDIEEAYIDRLDKKTCKPFERVYRLKGTTTLISIIECTNDSCWWVTETETKVMMKNIVHRMIRNGDLIFEFDAET